MSGECDLCGLPTPESPVTDGSVEGSFCCQGCLNVARTVADTDEIDASDIQNRLDGDGAEASETTADASDREDLAETYLAIEGMHCTTCEAFIAHRGESVEGVADIDASYASETARVTYDPDELDADELTDRLGGYGYTAAPREGTEDVVADARAAADRDTRQRLLVGGVLAFLVMPWYVFFLYPSYVGIETGILGADMTTTAGLYIPMGIVALLSAGVVFFTGWPILRGAWVSLRVRRPNMDLLLSIAILAAFGYSLVALASGSVHLYFDVAIAIVLVVTAGGYYEGRLKREATDLLSSLTAARVDEGTRRRPDGETETVAVEDLEPGDELLVRPGDRIPVDGTVQEGVAAVDEALVTGESVPVTKGPGDDVVGGSVVTDSSLVVAVAADGESTLDRITDMLWAIQSERRDAQRFADRLATVFVPLVIAVAVGATAWHLSGGGSVRSALLVGLTVLIAACPCAMGLATPLAIAAGLRNGLRRGLVVTASPLFEEAPDVDAVVFDKTGTLTTGEMAVREAAGDQRALAAAAALERRSSHPVADAITDHVTGSDADGADSERGSSAGPIPEAIDFERHPGEGISGRVSVDPDGRAATDGGSATGAPHRPREPSSGDGETVPVVVGTPSLVEDRCGELPADLAAHADAARAEGDVPVAVGYDGDPAAVIVAGDRERVTWSAVLDDLGEREVYVLTGDGSGAADRFREHGAVDAVFAGVPPDGKAETVRRLGVDRTVAMVGDGTNDAPALAAADVGIALDGTARAASAADVVVEGSLADVPLAFGIARGTRRRIRQNVGWALCYNGVAIPLAAAGALNPLVAALAMAASSLLVVTNSRRSVL